MCIYSTEFSYASLKKDITCQTEINQYSLTAFKDTSLNAHFTKKN